MNPSTALGQAAAFQLEVALAVKSAAETLGACEEMLPWCLTDDGRGALAEAADAGVRVLMASYEARAEAADKEISEPLLQYGGTVEIASTASEFVAADHFVLNTKPDAPVKISFQGDNFQTWFGEKKETVFAGSRLQYSTLARGSVDAPIIDELGGAKKAETTLTELFSLLQKQPRGEDGILLTNGYANIFYVKDVSDILRAVLAIWRGRGWDVRACPVENPVGWFDGYRVFSRNSC